jgi:hypothetical protein
VKKMKKKKISVYGGKKVGPVTVWGGVSVSDTSDNRRKKRRR